ncbi:hypothetical protein HKD37_15G041816 [Glycine soja]
MLPRAYAFQQQAVEYGAAGLQSQSSFQSTIYFGMLPRGLVPPSGPSTPINTRLTSATACLATMNDMLILLKHYTEMQQLICAFVLITLSFMMFSAEARNLHAFQQQAMEEPSAAGLQLQSLLFESTIGFGMLPRGAIPPSGPSTPTHSYCCCYYYS